MYSTAHTHIIGMTPGREVHIYIYIAIIRLHFASDHDPFRGGKLRDVYIISRVRIYYTQCVYRLIRAIDETSLHITVQSPSPSRARHILLLSRQ